MDYNDGHLVTDATPAPVPRFESDAMRVAPRIGEAKTELSSAAFQPPKRRGLGEVLVEPSMTRAAEVQRPARVMLTASWRGDKLQDRMEGLAVGESLADDCRLAGDAAESRERKQFDPISGRRQTHALPSRRRPGCA